MEAMFIQNKFLSFMKYNSGKRILLYWQTFDHWTSQSLDVLVSVASFWLHLSIAIAFINQQLYQLFYLLFDFFVIFSFIPIRNSIGYYFAIQFYSWRIPLSATNDLHNLKFNLTYTTMQQPKSFFICFITPIDLTVSCLKLWNNFECHNVEWIMKSSNLRDSLLVTLHFLLIKIEKLYAIINS